MNTVEEIKRDVDEEFNKHFYEGERNSVYCKKHNLFATPCELKCFLASVVDKVYSQAKLEVVEEMKKMFWEMYKKEMGPDSKLDIHISFDLILRELTELKSTLSKEKK